MEAESALWTDNLLFRRHTNPFFYNLADLQRYKKNARKYHQNSNPFPRIRQGSYVTKSDGRQRNDGKIERIAKILHIGVKVAFHIIKEA